ncbi:hypothetical protein [Paenibacillus sp. GCM10012306]|uniref:hypothetical protein n=1 Tax=Paenibacillus sp. GCM10012306 TaxID=3317342 RepID=UPI003620CA8B
MKKSEWLLALFLMGMGMLCMTLSAVSFRSASLWRLGSYVRMFLLCAVIPGVILFLVVRWIRSGRGH